MLGKSSHFGIYYAFAISISVIAYLLIGYTLPRENFTGLMLCILAAFAGYILLYWHAERRFSIKRSYQTAFLFRCLFILATPALSDDVYRFIWDGRLIMAGINPYLHLPEALLQGVPVIPGVDESLLNQLNSPHYHSVYPPFCQLIFYVSALLADGSLLQNVVWLRIFILASEGITLFYLPKVLEKYNLQKKAGLLYALNPLVIVELSGNLHPEAFLICFLVLFLYFLKEHKIGFAGLFFGLAVVTKLIPLIFLPLLISPLGWKRFIQFSIVGALITFFMFLPFLGGLEGIGISIALYFQKFEFNGSIYLVLRELGFILAGFNLIYWTGKLLAMITLTLILLYAWKNRKGDVAIPHQMLWVLFIYFIFSTTVHPWYIVTLILFAAFTNFRFPVVWSGLIFLTYFQYRPTGFQENLLIIAIEYGLLLLFVWSELIFRKIQTI